jgi:hypothetical protein
MPATSKPCGAKPASVDAERVFACTSPGNFQFVVVVSLTALQFKKVTLILA